MIANILEILRWTGLAILWAWVAAIAATAAAVVFAIAEEFYKKRGG